MTAGVREVATSSVLLLAENVIRLTAVAAASFWIARQLGPAQFGILNFASAFAAILYGLSTLGMDTPIILGLTRVERPGAILGTALAIRGVAGTLIMIVLAVPLAWALKRGDAIAMWATLIASLSVLGYVPTVLDYWFKARTSAGAPVLVRTSASLLSSVAKVVCVMLGLGVVALAWTVAIEAVLAGLGLVAAYFWFSGTPRRDPLTLDCRMTVPMLRQSAPYLLSSVGVVLYMKVDVVLLGYLSTNAETGTYSLAQKLSEVLYMVPAVLVDSAYPALTRRFLAAAAGTSQHGQMLFDIAVGGSIVATLVALAFAGPAIGAVFGSDYTRSVGIFYLHAWSCVAIAMNAARHRWLATLDLQRYAPLVTFVGLGINVAMNLLLIPSLGALGAAISTVVAYFVSGYLTSFWFAPLRPIGAMQTRALWPWGRLYRELNLGRRTAQ